MPNYGIFPIRKKGDIQRFLLLTEEKQRLHSLVGHLAWKTRGEGPQITLPFSFNHPDTHTTGVSNAIY
jgi:hypothetical protein